MQTVHKSTGKTQSKFQDQTFFEGFNWPLFNPGDIVWLEDYEGEVSKIAGLFVGYKNETEPIIRLLPDRVARPLANSNQNIETVAGSGWYYSQYIYS